MEQTTNQTKMNPRRFFASGWIDEVMRRPQNFLLHPPDGDDPIEVQPIDGGFWVIRKYGRVELELDANQAAKLFRELNNTSHSFVSTGEEWRAGRWRSL